MLIWFYRCIENFFYCILECPLGKYGLNCTLMCRYCLSIHDCSRVDGACTSGCIPGYHGRFCHQGKKIIEKSLEWKNSHLFIYFFFGHPEISENFWSAFKILDLIFNFSSYSTNICIDRIHLHLNFLRWSTQGGNFFTIAWCYWSNSKIISKKVAIQLGI